MYLSSNLFGLSLQPDIRLNMIRHDSTQSDTWRSTQRHMSEFDSIPASPSGNRDRSADWGLCRSLQATMRAPSCGFKRRLYAHQGRKLRCILGYSKAWAELLICMRAPQSMPIAHSVALGRLAAAPRSPHRTNRTFTGRSHWRRTQEAQSQQQQQQQSGQRWTWFCSRWTCNESDRWVGLTAIVCLSGCLSLGVCGARCDVKLGPSALNSLSG